MKNYEWYQSLIKPSFAPPSWIFAPVWTALYLILFFSFGYTIRLVLTKKIPGVILIPLALNLLSNFLFTPLQFGLKSNILAAVDILVVLGTLIWFMKVVYRYSKGLFLAQVPYFLWVSFATILQLSVTYLNR